MRQLILLVVGMAMFACDTFEETWEPGQTDLFANQSFTVAAGDSLVIGRIAFGGTGATRNHELAGAFTSDGPTRLIILEQLEYVEFMSGRTFQTTWESGTTTSGSWDFTAEPNGYHFIVDNRGSANPVTVTATITFRQEELVSVRQL